MFRLYPVYKIGQQALFDVKPRLPQYLSSCLSSRRLSEASNRPIEIERNSSRSAELDSDRLDSRVRDSGTVLPQDRPDAIVFVCDGIIQRHLPTTCIRTPIYVGAVSDQYFSRSLIRSRVVLALG